MVDHVTRRSKRFDSNQPATETIRGGLTLERFTR